MIVRASKCCLRHRVSRQIHARLHAEDRRHEEDLPAASAITHVVHGGLREKNEPNMLTVTIRRKSAGSQVNGSPNSVTPHRRVPNTEGLASVGYRSEAACEGTHAVEPFYGLCADGEECQTRPYGFLHSHV